MRNILNQFTEFVEYVDTLNKLGVVDIPLDTTNRTFLQISVQSVAVMLRLLIAHNKEYVDCSIKQFAERLLFTPEGVLRDTFVITPPVIVRGSLFLWLVICQKLDGNIHSLGYNSKITNEANSVMTRILNRYEEERSTTKLDTVRRGN